MRLSILQSNYIPWFGYFDIIRLSDVTVVFDSVQYTKNDWRNRNVISSPSGPTWLTIPVETSGRLKQPINEVVIADPRWAVRHWKTITQCLSRFEHFAAFRHEWEELYKLAGRMRLLHDINMVFIQALMARSFIDTQLLDDRQLNLKADTPTDRLIGVCRQLGANSYITGPAGLNYIDSDRFAAAGIGLEVIEYPSATADPGVQRVSILQTFAEQGEGLSRTLESSLHRIA
jgi:hypothetical protein